MKIVFKVFYLTFILGTVAACTPAPSTHLEDLEVAKNSPTNTVVPTRTPETKLLPTLTPEVQFTPTETPENDQILKVLFVGNSYTAHINLPEMFEELMVSGDHEIEVEQSTFGGWSLSNHALSSETTEKIAKTDWDYVILQEQSVVTNPDIGMYPAVRELNAQVEKIGAETILFMTWGRRDGLETAGFPDYLSMQAQVVENYKTIGEELELTIAPVGLVWQDLLAQNPNLQLWDADGSHPSKEGAYLAAAVFYAVLTHESPEGLDFLARISEETARILQSAAAEVILPNTPGSKETITTPTDPINPTPIPTLDISQGEILFSIYPNGEIRSLNLADGNFISLDNPPASQEINCDRHANWLPDGFKVSYTIDDFGQAEIWVMTSDGINQEFLIGGVATNSSHAWSPDGNTLAYVSDQNIITLFNPQDQTETSLTDQNFRNESDPDWSPDGSQIAFTATNGGNQDIYIINIDGTNLIRVTNHPDVDLYPDWSPDGEKIVFSSTRDGDHIKDLFMFDLNKGTEERGNSPTRLTSDENHNIDPDWSPDGALIVYASHTFGASHATLFLMDAQGHRHKQLTAENTYHSPKWRPSTSPISEAYGQAEDHAKTPMHFGMQPMMNLENIFPNIAVLDQPYESWVMP